MTKVILTHNMYIHTFCAKSTTNDCSTSIQKLFVKLLHEQDFEHERHL